MTPQTLLIAKGLVAVAQRPAWHDLRVINAVGIMMQATGGQMNPRVAADAFREMVREAGLQPIED